MTTRVPFVSLFQAFTTKEGRCWSKSKEVLEAQLVEMHEGAQVNRWEHLAPTLGPDLKHLSHRKRFEDPVRVVKFRQVFQRSLRVPLRSSRFIKKVPRFVKTVQNSPRNVQE